MVTVRPLVKVPAAVRSTDSLVYSESSLNGYSAFRRGIVRHGHARRFFLSVKYRAVFVDTTGHFKCNKKRIEDYPNLRNYVRDLYQMPEFRETVNFEHIKVRLCVSPPRKNVRLQFLSGHPIVFENLKTPLCVTKLMLKSGCCSCVPLPIAFKS